MTISIKGGTSATTTGKILDRPYVGLWKPNFRKTLSYAPDALVYINGDTSLVGCKDCNNRIDFQPYITQVSCGAGVEASSGDANISFSIPKHHGDSIFKDGAFLITPGLEVNVYIRGVFDVKDLNNDEIVEYPDEKYNLKDLKMKPYYPVFHGVVTSISYAYSGGFYNGSFSCNNLLYFWQYQFIDTNTAAMAARPSESAGSVQMTGHKFTGMTPHQIIYSLFRDTGGSAQGVVGGINKKSNVNARVGKQDAFSLSLRYWERRFSQGMYGLRMHGASGRLFSSLEQVYYGTKSASETNKSANKAATNIIKASKKKAQTSTANPLDNIDPFAKKIGVVKLDGNDSTRILSRGFDIKTVEAQSEKDTKGSTTADMQAYILDIGNLASINMWESSYESKQQVATTVAEKVNFEFYQDVDGDLVFKPPLYNLNTKASRVYVLKPEDIVSMNFSVKEPQYTYAVVKGTLTKNMAGVLDDEFITPKSTYIDYRLVAKYGWRPLEIDSNIHTNTTSAFYYAAAELDRQNQEAETASVTITLRPELKPGYPVYIEHIDCFYYVTSVSHDFTYGSSCSTTIDIKARRKRFMPPGDMGVSYKDSPEKAVDLINTNKGAKYLKKKEKTVGTSGIEGEDVIKVTGFPNVVMGIDMTRIDPNFWFMGTETLEIDKPYYKQMLIAEAISLGVLQLEESSKDPFAADAKFVVFDVVELGPPRQIGIISANDIAKGQIDFGTVIKQYQGDTKSSNKKLKSQTSEDKQKAAELIKEERDKAFNDLTNVDGDRTTGQQQENVTFIYSEEYEKTLLNPTQGTNPSLTLLDLINIIRINKQRSNEVSSGIGSTANILELLSNRKNAFSPHVPGYFRYFSCSHPDPKMQGSTEIDFSDENGEIKSVGERLIKISEERYNGNKVNMVVPDPTSTDGDLVTFTQAYPQAGLKVKNSFTNQVDVIPTNEITSLTFQEHEILIKNTSIKNKKDKGELWVGLPPGLYRAGTKDLIKRQFIYDFINNGLKINVKNPNGNTLFPKIITSSILNNTDIQAEVRTVIQTSDALFKQNTYVKDFEKRTTDTTNPLEELLEYAAGNLWQAIEKDHNKYFVINTPITQQNEGEFNTTKVEYQKLSKTIFALTELVIPPINKPNSTLTAKDPEGYIKGKPKKSMVFPVSDEEGYEVYGFQAYGRGLDLKVGGGYMSLLQQDYTRVFTSAQSENIYKILKNDKETSEKEGAVKGILKEVANSLSQMSPEERNIIINSTGIVVNQNSENNDQKAIEEAFISGFANRILSNQETDPYGKEDTNRFVVAENIPRALNQIAPGGVKNSGSVCQCRGYDSDLDLENLDVYNTPYVKLDFSGSEPDTFSQKLHDVMVEKGTIWKQEQASYRGSDTTENGAVLRNIVDTVIGAVDNIKNTVLSVDEKFIAITETYTSTLDAIDQKEKKALENNASKNVLFTEDKKEK